MKGYINPLPSNNTNMVVIEKDPQELFFDKQTAGLCD